MMTLPKGTAGTLRKVGKRQSARPWWTRRDVVFTQADVVATDSDNATATVRLGGYTFTFTANVS